MNELTAEKIKISWKQWVCFKLGDEEFGVDILKVREIVRIQSITHVPQTPASMAGVINLRGNVIPVIDLPKKLGIPDSKQDDKTRIIVFAVNDKLIGMIVDAVERVQRIRENQIEPPPDIGAGHLQEYIMGMGKVEEDLVILLNIDKILTEEEIIQIEDLKKIREFSEEMTEIESGKKPKAIPDKKSGSRIKAASPEKRGKRINRKKN
jgi:purine-binding chemotaxis protein CheW